jgi:hypothetical protein
MKGKQRKQAARFGPKWWNREGHVSISWPGHEWNIETWGMDGRWPRACHTCVDLYQNSPPLTPLRPHEGLL